MSGLSVKRGWVVGAVGAAVVAALALAGLSIQSLAILNVLTTAMIFIVLTQAWNILGGYGGYLNLGTAAFYGIGAYTVSILNHTFGWSPFLTAVLGGLAAVVGAMIIGIPSLRIRGVYFAILTLILTFLVQRLAFSVPFTRGALGIFLEPLDLDSRQLEQLFFFIFLGLAVVVTVVVRLIEGSRFGHALVAIREDEDAAGILGVRTTRTKMYAFGLGAFFMGLVGALVAQRVTFIDPDAAFSMTNAINPVIMAIYGGAGTWQGPLIGAPLVILLSELLRVTFGGTGIFGATVPAEVARLVFGAILIGVALYARRGIMGAIRPQGGSRRGV
ncbi:MAG: branched-chain amino acid ABC transporter permease [Actinomycetota bacterium]